ncbi:sulfotransferase family protein [Myxosarcina sp. GI1(2024)]
MKIDNFGLIIGTMKGGTTSLFNYLAQHPQVCPCSNKEPDFFSYQSRLSRGFDYYQSLWTWDPSTHKIAIEASVSYTRVTLENVLNAAEQIAKYKEFVNFKFIYILRNPLKRIESHYSHGIAYKSKAIPDSTVEALDREILDTSRYSMQIAPYYQRFPSDSILLLNFSDLKQKPVTLMRKVCCFLDIDPGYEFQNLSSIYNDSNNKKIRINWYGLNIPMKKNIRSLACKLPTNCKQAIHNLFGKKNQYYLKLSNQQKKHILAELKDDLQKLDRIYGFDVSQWNLDI